VEVRVSVEAGYEEAGRGYVEFHGASLGIRHARGLRAGETVQ
jgi:hypothetical protein